MDNLEQSGGMVDDGARVEPVTGNEVPPGSLDQEVRDDVDAKLSEGEYVLPADVVRFIGLGQIERMVAKAKKGLEEMEANGRIGGEPVDAEGVPMEDDELTPEEMQMLQEALGEAPTGMYMGGMVQQNPYQQQQMQYTNPNQPVGMAEGGLAGNTAPAFNPEDWRYTPSGYGSGQQQQATESVEYINPQTGDTMMITFVNGSPVGEIPDGFVVATEELKSQVEKSQKEQEEPLSPGNDSESDQRRQELEEEKERTNWAEQNYEKIMEDPVAYIKGELEVTKGEKLAGKLAPRVGGALAGPVGMLAGAGVSAATALTPLAKSRGIRDMMEKLGMDTTEADELIDAYTSDLPPGLRTVDNLVPSDGTMYFNSLIDQHNQMGMTSPSKPKEKLFVPGAGKKREGDGAAEEKRAQERYDAFSKEYEKNVESAKKDQYGQTTGKGLTVKDIEDDLMPMAKGGFVAKPSNYKSKVTRKKEKKRRGLGSK